MPRRIDLLDPVVGGQADDRVLWVSQVDLGGLREGRFELGPPSFVELAHLSNDFRVLFGDVVLLSGVGRQCRTVLCD